MKSRWEGHKISIGTFPDRSMSSKLAAHGRMHAIQCAPLSDGSVFLKRTDRREFRYGSLESSGLNELVAQLVEQRPFKAWVLGSIPSELTRINNCGVSC